VPCCASSFRRVQPSDVFNLTLQNASRHCTTACNILSFAFQKLCFPCSIFSIAAEPTKNSALTQCVQVPVVCSGTETAVSRPTHVSIMFSYSPAYDKISRRADNRTITISHCVASFRGRHPGHNVRLAAPQCPSSSLILVVYTSFCCVF
jgi:hypothetical protein